jgi:hypothetical protein
VAELMHRSCVCKEVSAVLAHSFHKCYKIGRRSAAENGQYDMQAYAFSAAPEQLRAPRVVRVGLVQNSIVLPTTAPYVDQAQVRRLRSKEHIHLQHKCTQTIYRNRNAQTKAPYMNASTGAQLHLIRTCIKMTVPKPFF